MKVPVGDVAGDPFDQFTDAAEAAFTNGVLGEVSEKLLYHVHPGTDVHALNP